jgi:hypothetical protein
MGTPRNSHSGGQPSATSKTSSRSAGIVARTSARCRSKSPWGWRRPGTPRAGSCRPCRPARVLTLHPDRGRALLEEPGLVHHQHRAWIAQVLQDVGAQIIADQVGIPLGGGQQPLHPIRGGLAGVLGQLPAVFPVLRRPAVRADTPAPAGAARPGRTDPRCGRASPPAPPPTPALPRFPQSPHRHPARSFALLALGAADTIPAGGREPYLKTSAAGVLGASLAPMRKAVSAALRAHQPRMLANAFRGLGCVVP